MKFPTYLESIVWLELKIKQLLINIFPVSEVITTKHSVLVPTKTKNIPLQQKSGGNITNIFTNNLDILVFITVSFTLEIGQLSK